ncbi:MAG TPA: calcium-binding protein [Conexibacter sp.]|nr:calcium-binding protein [Conexibacter sp.]
MRLLRLTPLLLALALLLPPAAASGSTISLTFGEEEVPKGAPVRIATVLWQAAAGEANAGELRFGPGEIAVRDAGAPIAAGSGCAAAADGWVACSLGASPRNTAVRVDLGDGDDALRTAGDGSHVLTISGGAGDDRIEAIAPETFPTLAGGPGDDTLIGGPQRDLLRGEEGADRLFGNGGYDRLTGDPYAGPFADDLLDGGPGGDEADYSVREQAVAVDLAAGVGGSAGERDTLTAIENVSGGDRADVLRGDDGPNELSGYGHQRGGLELIDGRGGDDRLDSSGSGQARLDGGDGDDRIDGGGRITALGGAGNDRLSDTSGLRSCGPGRDRVALDGFSRAIVATDCERVDLPPFFVTQLHFARRAVRLTLRADAIYPRSCQVRARLRQPGARAGAVLAARTLRGPRGRPLRVVLAAPRALPPRVRVELRAFACRGELRRGAEDEPPASFPLQRAPVAQVPTPAQAP